jgi:hypothetical protein
MVSHKKTIKHCKCVWRKTSKMLPSSSQEGRAGERRAMMTYDMLTFFF